MASLTLNGLVKAAKDLGCELLSTTECPCTEVERHNGETCITAEEHRALTREEKRKGWARWPFNAYDARTMCDGCAAYWFASMCGITLESIQNAKRYVEARKAV